MTLPDKFSGLMMVEFFHARRLRYLIEVLIEGRWQIVTVVDDERDLLNRVFDKLDLVKLESRVENMANSALRAPGVSAVKVVRQRQRDDGFEVDGILFQRETQALKPFERQVANFSGAAPICQSVDDVLDRPAIRMLGIVLRPLLDQLHMTPLELVTCEANSRAMKRAENAEAQAVAAIARQQATQLKVDARLRVVALEKLVKQARDRIHAADRINDPPKIGKDGIEPFLTAVNRRFPTCDQRYWALRGMSEYTEPAFTFPAKLERALALNAGELSLPAVDLLDEVVACIVDHQEVIRELLGEQPDLRWALLRLAGLIRGETPKATTAPDLVARLIEPLGQGRMPKTRDALWDRLVRSIDSRQNFSHAGIREEWAAVAQLQSEILPRLPETLHAVVSGALTKRQATLRQQLLEEL